MVRCGETFCPVTSTAFVLMCASMLSLDSTMTTLLTGTAAAAASTASDNRTAFLADFSIGVGGRSIGGVCGVIGGICRLAIGTWGSS